MKRGALVLTLVLLLCAGCETHETAENRGEPDRTEPAAPIEVRGSAVRRGEITSSIAVSGETAAARVLRLASPVAGRITTLSVLPGDSLGAGQVAARVLPAENDAAIHGFHVLDDNRSLGPEERRRAGQLSNDMARRDIALAVPFGAVVADRLHNPGELVAANDVLLELFDPDSLYVLAQAPIGAPVAVGMPVELRTSGNAVARGRVTALQAAVAPQALTVPTRIALDVPPPRLLLHAPVQCRIALATHTDALLVPRRALLTASGAEDSAVMIADGDRARERRIHLGLQSGDLVEVTEGLAEGDVVLVEGQYAIPDGTRIAVRTATD